MEDIYRAVGIRLRAARLQKGLLQEDVGTAIGVSDATVADWENGKSRISIAHLVEVARFLGKPASYLLGQASLTDGAVADSLDVLPTRVRSSLIQLIEAVVDPQAPNDRRRAPKSLALLTA